MSETFLGGRVRVTQPLAGFRAGLDAVMLAAAVPAHPGDTALELGAGSGAASLCLAVRVDGVDVTGIEIAPALAHLANDNAAANGMAARARFVAADLFALPPAQKQAFDHVFVNPPFHGEGIASADAARARALQDGGRLGEWLAAGLKRTVSNGTFTVILRADRLPEALAALPRAGLAVLPLWPRAGEPARRAIVQIRKGSAAPFALLPGLVLHRADGSWTAEADAVLRDGAALALTLRRL